MKKYFLSLCLSFIIISNSYAESFNAYINRNNIPEGETFVLTLELKDSSSQTTPDISSLSKDFTILSVSNGYRTNIINGNVSKSRQWSLVMIPNSAGAKTIPSIKLDNLKTKPINLTVISADTKTSSSQDLKDNSPKFKILAKIDNLTPYVQQQVNYQIKLYDTGGLQGEAPFFDNLGNNWIARSLGQPQITSKIVNGRTLREITFNYALFPQVSGELTIPSVIFNGFYLTKSTRRDPFADIFGDDDFFSSFGMNDVFANKNPVVLRTKELKVKVLPMQSNDSWWLPAKDVKLSAEFATPNPQFKVGEAINRTIYLKAKGVIDTQLPEISFAQVAGVKQYPEKPEVQMNVENNDVVSTSKISNVYIPDQAGEITLPPIKVKWFNTTTKQYEIASIPSYKTNVSANPDIISKASALNNSSPDAKPLINNPTPKAETRSIVSTENSDYQGNNNFILMIILAFFGGIILTVITVFLILHFNSSVNYKQLVINSAKSKDIKSLKDNLLLWAQKKYSSDIKNLHDISSVIGNKDFSNQIDILTASLYSDSASNFDNYAFIKQFKLINKQSSKNRKNQNDPLPKLYK